MAAESLNTSSSTLIAVVGPTASGKTDLALALAHKTNGEIISADMGQLYKKLDAGTAKPKGKRQQGTYLVEQIPYHLVDEIDPKERFDAGQYARAARPLIEDMRQRGKRPILAGGTGLYLRALLEGLDEVPAGDETIRTRLMQRLQEEGREKLYAYLTEIDPIAAKGIPAGNTQRLLRALEVFEISGKPISSFWSKAEKTQEDVLYTGIEWPSEQLRERIRLRAEEMFPAMLTEVRRLISSEYSGKEPGFRCLGYPEALACVRSETTAEEGLRAMVASSYAYAKRQRTWFRNQTPVRWLTPADRPPKELADIFLETAS